MTEEAMQILHFHSFHSDCSHCNESPEKLPQTLSKTCHPSSHRMKIGILSLYGFLLILIHTSWSYAQVSSSTPQLQVTHQTPHMWLHLYQSTQQTLQIWHQQKSQQSVLELASPAGGCRVQLYLHHTHSPKLTRPQPLTSRQSRSILKRVKALTRSKITKKQAVFSMEMSIPSDMSMDQVLSTGCPLNRSMQIQSQKIKNQRYKVSLSPQQEFKKKLLKHLQTITPTIQHHQIWQTTPMYHTGHNKNKAQSLKELWLYDDEFIVYVQIPSSVRSQVSYTSLSQPSFSTNTSNENAQNKQTNSTNIASSIPTQIRWTHKQKKAPSLKIYVINLSKPLTPLKELFAPHFKSQVSAQPWHELLQFLSYQEGIYPGLSAGLSQNTFDALPGIALLMPFMSNQWLDVAMKQALIHTRPFPNTYKTPVDVLDPRFFLSPVLSYYLLSHPHGKQQASALLNSKHQQRLLGSYATPNFTSLWRYSMHFAHRPSQKHLFQSTQPVAMVLPIHLSTWQDEKVLTSRKFVRQALRQLGQSWQTIEKQRQTDYTYLENSVLNVQALYHSYRILNDETRSALLGGFMSSAQRAKKLSKAWSKSRSFFTRKLDVNEARRRTEMWGNFLEIKDFYDSFRDLTHSLNLPVHDLGTPQLNASTAADLLWGRKVDEITLKAVMNLMHEYPAGLLDQTGVKQSQKIIFKDKFAQNQSHTSKKSEAWHQVLWNRGLAKQSKRHWKAKTRFYIARQQQKLWQRISQQDQIEQWFIQDQKQDGEQAKQEQEEEQTKDKTYTLNQARVKKPFAHPWHLLNTAIITIQKPKVLPKNQTVKASELR